MLERMEPYQGELERIAMSHVLQLTLLFLAASGISAGFFGGLAWTIRRWTSGGGALLVPGSFILRSTVLVTGFWFLARNDLKTWIVCLLGFTAARLAVQRVLPVQYWSVRRGDGRAPHN